MENSNKTSYFLKYEISPLLVTKLNQLDGSSYSSIYKAPSFLAEKNNFLAKNLPNNFKLNINDFNKHANTNEQNYKNVSSYNNKNINSFNYNDIKFESKLFNNNINVYTNINIAKNNQFINKKRNRFISPKDYKMCNLNEISIQNYHLNNFPLINLTEEQKVINILIKLTNKKNYFKIRKLDDNNNNNILNEKVLDDINIPISILKSNNLYYYENEMNAHNILFNYYNDIKNIILIIQRNYLNKIKKIYNEKNLLKLEILIRNCNLFSNYIIKLYKDKKIPFNKNNNEIKNIFKTDEYLFSKKDKISLDNPPFILKNNKKIPFFFQNNLNKNLNNQLNNEDLNENQQENNNNNNKLKKKKKIIFLSKIKKDKFICEFCNKEFKNGQAYGGHLSQTHPNQSKKYKEKIKTRNRRENIRDIIENCRKEILKKYGYDYNNLSKENCNKKIFKQVLKEHKIEYRKLLINMKKIYGILPDSRKNK